MGEPSLLVEVEDAMASRSVARRGETLRKVTDLFVDSAERYNQQQVALFDDVLGRLADSTDNTAKAELSQRISTVANAPANLVDRLACDESFEVAQHVLANSTQVSEARIAELASSKGRRHMLAIASRKQLAEQITDTLLKRADPQVVRTVATNGGAKVSEKGFETLSDLAKADASLAEVVVQRQDIPHKHFRTLIAMAPRAVQDRLAAQNPRLAERIRHAIAEAEEESRPVARDYTGAKETVDSLFKNKMLDDETVHDFAKAEQFEESVVALAVLCGLTIGPAVKLMTDEPISTLLIAARAAELTWPTVKALMLLKTAGHSSPQDIEDARMNFIRLNPMTAKQGLKFYKQRVSQS
jgi:uncharacterized protein (DUF2336 family)